MTLGTGGPFTLGVSLYLEPSCDTAIVAGYIPPAGINIPIRYPPGGKKQYTITDVYKNAIAASAADRAAQVATGAQNFLNFQAGKTNNAFGFDGVTANTASLNDNGPVPGNYNMSIVASSLFDGSYSYYFAGTTAFNLPPKTTKKTRRQGETGTGDKIAAGDIAAAISLWVNAVGNLVLAASKGAGPNINRSLSPLDATVLNVLLAVLTNAISFQYSPTMTSGQTSPKPSAANMAAAWDALAAGPTGVAVTPIVFGVGLTNAVTQARRLVDPNPRCPDRCLASYGEKGRRRAQPEALKRIRARSRGSWGAAEEADGMLLDAWE